MQTQQALLLFAVSTLAGGLNSVAGGGSFFTVPALLSVHVPPVAANATSTVALWPASVAGAVAYREELSAQRSTVIPMCSVSVLGGLLGALLLLKTPDGAFLRMLPWLLLAATCLFAAGPRITSALRSRQQAAGRSPSIAAGAFLQLIVATYGGYFGGGIGILMLALLSVIGQTDIHRMNALKTVLGSIINGVAVVVFLLAGKVMWHQFGVMVIGAVMGGYMGARIARRLPQKPVRRFVIGAGMTMTCLLFAKSMGAL
jgi:uncharacterized membrane protein YfcA